ncbi:MAG: HEAT repeat domain-containing protein [Gemmatimonadota bacterium]
MSGLDVILALTAFLATASALFVMAWFAMSWWLVRVERRLAERKGLYREFVAGLAARDQDRLEPVLRTPGTLHDFEALEAVLEEQARATEQRPAWLLDAYDRLGLVDKYIKRLREGRRWRDRAFAAELLGRVGNARAVPPLLETIQSTTTEDGDVREIALRALARIADPVAVGPLIEALKKAEVWLVPRIADILGRHGDLVTDPMVAFLNEETRHPARAWAAAVLGEVKAPRAYPVLLKSLNDLDDEVRAKSAGALGRLGDTRAVRHLLDRLLTDPIPFVRARIAGALGQFPGDEVVESLVRSLGDPAWWVRMRSVEALEQIGTRAERPLLVALDDIDPEIRIRAAVSLERLGVPARLIAQIAAGTPPVDAEEILVRFAVAGAKEMLAEQLDHASPAVRVAVVHAARRAGRRELEPDLALTARRDADATVRTAALEALRALSARSSLPAAVDALGDADEHVRAEALALIGDLGSADLTAAVVQRLDDPSARVRAGVAKALGLVRATGVEEAFERLAGDPASEVRAAAAGAAADGGWNDAAPTLVRMLGDSEPAVRLAAARALGRVGNPSSVPTLIRLAMAPELDIRLSATEAVARLDPDRIADLLDRVLESNDSERKLTVVRAILAARVRNADRFLALMWRDPDPAVRAAVAEALARLGGDPVAALLTQGLVDPDPAVRRAAIEGLTQVKNTAIAPDLVRLLDTDPDAEVRERAALGVGLLGAPGGEAVLLAACHADQPVGVRAAAALALGLYEEESIVARVIEMADEHAVRAHLRAHLSTDPFYRAVSLKLRDTRQAELRALAAESLTGMEAALADGVRSMLDADGRRRLVAGLRSFRGEKSRGALLQIVRGDPAPEVRAAALAAVADLLDRDELLDVGKRALGDPHPAVRRTAVQLFRRLPTAVALPNLIRLLRADDDPAVLQGVAAQAEAAFDVFLDLTLGLALDGAEGVMVVKVARFIHHPKIARVLLPIAASPAPEVREAVAELWSLRPDLVDLPTLDRLSLDPVVTVRRAAGRAWAVVRKGDGLARLASDPDPQVRLTVARALANLIGPAPALSTLIKDPDESVRAAAAVGLLLRGEAERLPARVSRDMAAAAASELVAIDTLRLGVQTEPDPIRRRAMALVLALLDPAAGRLVAQKDPSPEIRQSVAIFLDPSLLEGSR